MGATTISSGGEPPALIASEDELYEALRRGEITYEQYLMLQELIVNGVDSSNAFILDDLPSLDLNAPDSGLISAGDTAVGSAAIPVKGALSYRYYRHFDEDSQLKYQNNLTLTIGTNWRSQTKIRREFSGRERVVGRSLTYRNRRGLVREMTFGSFTKRMGLGTVIGYRGKLFDYSPDLDLESWLFPDNGGQNGLYVRLGQGSWEMQTVGSVYRDSEHKLTTVGFTLARNGRHFTPAVIVGWNHLANRSSDGAANLAAVAFYARYTDNHSYHTIELCRQNGHSGIVDAIILEGRHRSRSVVLQYAGWVYSETYADISSGSKTGNISRSEIIEAADFDYSNKRAGQEGLSLKTTLRPGHRIQPATSFFYASLNADTSDFQWLSEIAALVSGQLTISAEHLTKIRTRFTDDIREAVVKRQTRLEMRYQNESVRVRSHIGYNSKSKESDNLVWMVYLKYRSSSCGSFELSSNLSEIDPRTLKSGYWYFYVTNDFRLLERLCGAVKFSHSYYRSSTEPHRNQISLEVTCKI